MNPTFKNLLFRGESETLEFKADNYSLDDDDEKGELLKDLLAFVNAWRETDAFILLGVQGMNTNGEAEAIRSAVRTFNWIGAVCATGCKVFLSILLTK